MTYSYFYSCTFGQLTSNKANHRCILAHKFFALGKPSMPRLYFVLNLIEVVNLIRALTVTVIHFMYDMSLEIIEDS